MDAALIEAAVVALEQLVPAIIGIVEGAGLDPDTVASYTARIQAAMANVTKPAGT